ncbi:MAG: CoA-transferase [Smithellaceae bacterium]|jgi:acyl CoA:acetate/3-ketoacid CoA transferase alpha subunit/acyl CoA:acetate/3-ketoacid CoA transferase beta subunit
MDIQLKEFLQEKLTFRDSCGAGKVMELSDAVRQFVKPSMSIQFGNGMTTPTAIFFEIARQFWGKNPGFTIIGISGGVYNVALFVHGKLCSKIIAAFAGDGYPFPGPNPILARALREGTVSLENWTQLTIVLRFMAGALGVPFFPTKSIRGSSMEVDNKDSFCQIPNPFEKGESASVVKAYNPDIAIAHGWAADKDGNTIMSAPYSGNHFGALAAKEGVIVTVEKIVDTAFIRRHAHMTRLPGYIVKAVCPAPMGGHPMGIHALGVSELEGYGEDEEWIIEARKASRNSDEYQAWVEKWVLGCKNHEDFLSRLGQQRIWHLKGKIQNDSWMSELSVLAGRLPSPHESTPAERLVSASSNKIMEIIKTKNYRLALCGIGVSNLAAWLAYYKLHQEEYSLELVAEIGYYGYSPQPSDPYVFNLRNIPSCKMISDIFTSLGIIMGGSQTSSIGVIGAGQVDRLGNVNTTRLSVTGPFLVGSGGANDVASSANETIVTLEQNKSRFVEKVAYITSPGIRVTTVISQLGIWEKESGNNELALTGYFPVRPSASEEESVRSIQEQCGWKLKVKSKLQILPLPSAEELKLMRCFDPKRFFLGGDESQR